LATEAARPPRAPRLDAALSRSREARSALLALADDSLTWCGPCGNTDDLFAVARQLVRPRFGGFLWSHHDAVGRTASALSMASRRRTSISTGIGRRANRRSSVGKRDCVFGHGGSSSIRVDA
jgi:hypothetical protein